MTKSDELLNVLAKAVNAGGGIHSATELAFMLGVPCDPAFRKFLTDCVSKGPPFIKSSKSCEVAY
jgi:hypothetical protein